MFFKPSISAAVIGVGLSALAAYVPTTVRAQDAIEAEMIGYHQLCQKGDRRACIRFGILIGRNEQRHADWHRIHSDWWWWERG
jgi:hypothetical protein